MGHRRPTRRAVPRVAVVGCGHIGSLYDERYNDDRVLTHLSGYLRYLPAEQIAVCDADRERLDECAQRRGVARQYIDYQKMFDEFAPDIVSVCTPTTMRYDVIKAAIASGARVVFCEKPVSASLSEAEQITGLTANSEAVVVVNYLRRWAPGIRRALREVVNGGIGDIQLINGTYCKGLLNCGSHLIDLLQFCFGPSVSARCDERIDDGRVDDPTMNAVLTYQHDLGTFSARLQGTDHRHFFIFELDIIGTKGRLRLTNLGQEVRSFVVAQDGTFPDTRTLTPRPLEAGEVDQALAHAVEHVISLYRGDVTTPLCTAEEATQVLRTVDAIERSYQLKGEPVVVSRSERQPEA